jgi:hypothetical protein
MNCPGFAQDVSAKPDLVYRLETRVISGISSAPFCQPNVRENASGANGTEISMIHEVNQFLPTIKAGQTDTWRRAQNKGRAYDWGGQRSATSA